MASKELDEIKDALSKISGAAAQNKEALEYVKGKLDKDPSHLEKALPALKNVVKAVPALMSKDPKKIFVGVIDTIGALAPLAGPEGEVVSVVLSFVTALFGGSSGPSVSDVVKEAIDDALKEYKAEDLREDLEGVATEYRNSAAYLKGLQGKPLAQHEVGQLMSNVPIWQGVHYLGKVSHYINTESQNTKNKTEDDAKRVLTFLQLYIQLSLTRQMLLTQMCEIVILSKTAPATVTGIIGQLKAQHNDCMKAAQFLNHPTVTQAFYTSVLCATPEGWHCIMPYYKDVGPNMSDGVYTVCPQEWPDWFIACHPDNQSKWLASQDKDAKIQLTFRKVEDNPGYWFITNGGSFYFNENKEFAEKPMQHDTHWKIIATKEGNLLASQAQPCKFARMEDNWVEDSLFHVEQGNPGKTGYWHIKPAK